MAGIPISSFLDWSINTGPQFLSDNDNIVNNVSQRSFILGKFLRGKPASQILQGSNKIRETLYLKRKRTGRTFKRGDSHNWTNKQKDVNVQFDYRFFVDHLAWDEWEYEGQTSSFTGMDGASMQTAYKNMDSSKKQGLWDSVIHTWENDILWLPPVDSSGNSRFSDIESADGQEFYSIPCFIHENASNNGGFDSNWTTVGQVNQATYGADWDNYRATYDETDPTDAGGNRTGLFNAFDDASISIGYSVPGFKDQFFEPDNSYTKEDFENGGKNRKEHYHCIATSKAGLKLLMHLHRTNNDSLIQPADAAYPMNRWNGIPITDVAALDTAALYLAEDSSSYVAEEAAGGTTATNVDKTGPRYYMIDTRYMKMIFHRAKYFKMEKKKEPDDKLGEYVIPVQCWGNLVCTGRRWQAIVSPT